MLLILYGNRPVLDTIEKDIALQQKIVDDTDA